jgi:ppGpp synthetase/RelA/SpoT-type nucleotidyltranferase
MKNILFSLVFIFVIVQVQAQCKIGSVKEGPSRLEINDERGSSMTFVQWNGKDAYDYSSCWLGVAVYSSGYSYVHLYDGTRNTSQKSISFMSGRVKSVKIIGNKVKAVYENGREETKDIN